VAVSVYEGNTGDAPSHGAARPESAIAPVEPDIKVDTRQDQRRMRHEHRLLLIMKNLKRMLAGS
jgi:hypothetical protein